MSTGLKRYIVALLVLAAAAAAAHAQEVYQASWTVQDRRHELQQNLAHNVIARANDWLTREDNTAPTARIDDPLRVSVIVSYDPTTKLRTARLVRLTLGAIIIDNGFSEFLSKATIDSLVRRNYFWRDETLTVINEELWPYAARNYEEDVGAIDDYALAFAAADNIPGRRLDLNESSVSISRNLRLWAGLGFEELALPGFSYSKLRSGAAYGRLKAWLELPASFFAADNALLARGLDGTFGAGLAFEDEMIGAALTWSDASGHFGHKALAGDTGYVLGRSALFYVVIPIGPAPSDEGFIRMKLGPGYIQTVRRINSDSATVAFNHEEDRFKLMARLEYAAANAEGRLKRSAAAEIFTEFDQTSILLSWNEQVTPAWGVRASLTAHGLLGARDPYLPAVSLMISPTYSF